MKKHFFTLTLATLTLIACKKEEQQRVDSTGKTINFCLHLTFESND